DGAREAGAGARPKQVGKGGAPPRLPRQCRGVLYASATPSLSALVTDQVRCLASGQQHEELPEVVAVVQAREAADLDTAAETVEGAEGDIFLVGGTPRHGAKTTASQAHQTLKVRLPELLGRFRVARLEPTDPVRDRSYGGHRPSLSVRGSCQGRDTGAKDTPMTGATRTGSTPRDQGCRQHASPR